MKFRNYLLCLSAIAAARSAQAQVATNDPTRLPTVVVTAQKTPRPEQALPLSVTAVTRSTITEADVTSIKEAATYSPNTFINQFTARAVSNPTFRGISGSPLNPGVTTFVDGVPQLNNYSSSFELLDVDQVEFIRGPQSALFGRNTAAGLINITSRRPSDVLGGWIDGQYGNYNLRDVRGGFSGPWDKNKDQGGFSLSAGFSARDGYTKNDFTGHDLDSREAGFGKGQFLYKASDKLEIRLILSGETDRDGDYSLGDLAFIRSHPHHVSRDFEGFNHRDLMSAALIANYTGEKIDFSATTAGSWLRNEGLTDLDYTAFPGNTRDNKEQQNQFTQEFRFGSGKDKPISLAKSLDLSWQSGMFIFTQDYNQHVVNNAITPVPFPPFFVPVNNQTGARLEDWGLGFFGQGKLTAWEKLDLTAGLRVDYESKSAGLNSLTIPAFLSPASSAHFGDSFTVVSPQMSLDYRYNSNQMTYISVARGYKAGGFNAASPAGNTEYGTEHSWNYELGHKSLWLDGRLSTKAAVYYVDWSSLQLNQPVPGSGGTAFYIANAGKADSKGVELEANFKASQNWDFFGSVGYDDARFCGGSTSLGLPVGGHRLPYAPSFTGNFGSQFSWAVCKDATLYVRATLTLTGDFEYDASNGQSQSTYALTDIRAGIRTKHWFVEGWADNAFDSHYVPIAIPFSTASGYVGESGDPVTFGLRAGLSF